MRLGYILPWDTSYHIHIKWHILGYRIDHVMYLDITLYVGYIARYTMCCTRSTDLVCHFGTEVCYAKVIPGIQDTQHV